MIIILLVACFIYASAFRNNSDKDFVLCIWILFFISGFRHPALGGADTFQYYDVFMDMSDFEHMFNAEVAFRKGFLLMNVIPRLLSDSYIIFQIFYIGVCTYLLYKIVIMLELNGKEKCLFLFGFFCYDYMWYFWGTLRQNVADLFFFWLIIYLVKNREYLNGFKKYLIMGLCVVIPNLFHTSALINVFMLPPFLLMPSKVNPKGRMYLVIIGSLLIYATSSLYISIFSSYAAFLDDRYSSYMEDAGVASNVINLIFKLVVFSMFCMNYDSLSYKYKKMILDAATFFILVSSVNYGIAGRVAAYYAFGFYAVLAFIPSFKNFGGVLKYAYFATMIVIFSRKMLVSDQGLNSHYYLFFQDPVEIPSLFRAFWNGLKIY